MIFTQLIGIGLLIAGVLLLLVSYGIFRITRSKRIGALFVVLVLIGVCLIGAGIWLIVTPYLPKVMSLSRTQ